MIKPSLDDKQAEHSLSRRQPRRLQLIVILGALSAFGPLSIDMYLPSLPSLSRELSTGASEVQLTLSACLLGLALGQVIVGPISDSMGRRKPLLIGLLAYALASCLCVIAPSIYVLIFLRFVQGCAGAAGIVLSRAIVRDLYSGLVAAKFFSLLMVVNGLAPILAPICGALLLRVTTWRGVFVVLTIIGILLILSVFFGLRETLPLESRQSGGLPNTLHIFRQLLGSRAFVGYALSCGLAFAAMFAYISGSPFVVQNIYGLSPQFFSIMFGVNALGIMFASQINGRLVERLKPERLLLVGLGISSLGGILLLLTTLGGVGLLGILPALFLVVASLGFVLPNATTLALAGHPSTAGSASALLGVLQYAVGAAAAPLVGIGGSTTALPMAVVIATLSGAALLTYLLFAKKSDLQPSNENHIDPTPLSPRH